MRAKIWLGTVMLCLLPILASAQDQQEALVQELYVKSGLAKQVQQLPQSIQAGLDQPPLGEENFPKPPAQDLALMKALVPQAFAPESLKPVMLSEFRKKLATRDLQAVLKWLDSPLGSKCTQLEEEASTPESYAEMQKYATHLKSSPPSLERLKVIRQLDNATKATKSTTEMIVSTQTALALAINATLPREQQRSLGDISREMEKHRPDLEETAKLETLVSLLYTYKNLTEAELRQYIKFATTPAGSKFQAVADAALKKALTEGAIRWGRAIGEALKNETGRVSA